MSHHERCAVRIDPILRCTCEHERDWDVGRGLMLTSPPLCDPTLSAHLHAAEDFRCVTCSRRTVETGNDDNPRQRREQASGAYVLCARCEKEAKDEAREPTDEEWCLTAYNE